MRTLLISLVAVALVGGLVGGGLFAYFSDTESSEGNTFQAGTIDIKTVIHTVPVDGGDSGTQVWCVDGDGEVCLDMKPCQTGYLVFLIANVGQNPADIWKQIKNVQCTEGLNPEPEQQWYTDNGPTDKNDIDTVIKFDLWFENDNDPDDHEFNPDQGDIMYIDEADGFTVADVEDHGIYLGELAPGAIMHIVQSFHMDFLTENWAQGDVMEFDEDYIALQTVGNPPIPSFPNGELTGFGKADW